MRADDAGMETTFMRRLRDRRRRAFIESYAFPLALRQKLREKLESDEQVDVALEGLREWYLACLEAPGEMLGMPSRVVDLAWHEMILMTRIYHAFCERAFGHYLHHSPEAVMDEPLEDGLARTLAVLEGRSVAAAGMPLLFAVDGRLRPEDGYVWDEQDIGRLRSLQRHRWADYSGAGFAGPGCSSGCASGGGGCGGGG
jgi:uncharacterized membrane protein YgcG